MVVSAPYSRAAATWSRRTGKPGNARMCQRERMASTAQTGDRQLQVAPVPVGDRSADSMSPK